MIDRRHALMLGVAAAATPVLAASRKIATLGSGKVGSALGSAWIKQGHRLMFSSRRPETLKDFVAGLGANASAGTVKDAIAFADVVVLAVPYGALPDLGREHAVALAAKALVIDTCNPFPNRDGEVAAKAIARGPGLYTQDLLPGSKIVRAFNAISAARMNQGGRLTDGRQMAMPIAGDDDGAITLATELIKEIGFDPVLVGNLDFGKHLQPRLPLGGEHTTDEIRTIAKSLS
ncbi:MAG: NADP oxidoreductase [Alphaproteobacteria bacterium]|nr:NADP oxidoreductase [Alphaproteobacteria bacterium]